MWPKTQCFCLILSAIISGSLLAPPDIKVSQVVTVPRGGDAVLNCSFTHLRQQDYSGTITVKWLARESKALPFFICSVKNDSMVELNDCADSGLRHSLKGDPRRGELSLLIRRVHLADNGSYFCRVELDGRWEHHQKETHLYVTAKPQILSLSVVKTSSRSGNTTRSLQCEVEGHPLPSITWLSASRSLLGDQVQTSQVGPYRLVSSVPYLEEDVFTCRVESRLGGAERRFPARNTLMITLTVCGLIVLLMLLLTGFICYHRKKKGARDRTAPIYENVDVEHRSCWSTTASIVENYRLQGSDFPAEGDVELNLVYSDVSLTAQHPSFKSPTQHLEETDVYYSPVNVVQ